MSSFSCAIAQIPEHTISRDNRVNFVFIVIEDCSNDYNVNLINLDILINSFFDKLIVAVDVAGYICSLKNIHKFNVKNGKRDHQSCHRLFAVVY